MSRSHALHQVTPAIVGVRGGRYPLAQTRTWTPGGQARPQDAVPDASRPGHAEVGQLREGVRGDITQEALGYLPPLSLCHLPRRRHRGPRAQAERGNACAGGSPHVTERRTAEERSTLTTLRVTQPGDARPAR